jgi:hypothetical protein
MADESEKKEDKNGESDPGKQIFYTKLEHSKLVDITLGRDKRITSLEKQNTELQEELIKLRIRLKAHEPEKYDRPSYMGYQQDWPVIRKVIFILKRNARALTSLRVMEELLSLEPLYKMAWNDPANNVSSILSRACKKNLIMRVSSGMGAPIYKVIKHNKAWSG